MANDKHGDWGGKHIADHHSSDTSSDHHGQAWGLDVAGDDGPAWGLDVTDHGPAWGVHVDEDDDFDLPVVLDDDVLGEDGSGWDMGLSAYGIDDASITGDNPVADAYLGQSGQGCRSAPSGWTTTAAAGSAACSATTAGASSGASSRTRTSPIGIFTLPAAFGRPATPRRCPTDSASGVPGRAVTGQARDSGRWRVPDK